MVHREARVSAESDAEMRPAVEQPAERRVRANGVELCLFEWAGDDPPVLLVHATGFHARSWDAVARRLPGRRVIAVDMRGHGRSERTDGPYTWRRFGNDIVDLVRVLDLRGAVGVGHSMGGHSVTYAAAEELMRFAALLLVDPVISRHPSPAARRDGEGELSSDFVARRRNQWGSPEEMIERFRGRFPHSLWRPEVLEDYARHGLLPAPDGEGYVLACPPAIEAEIYRYSREFDVHDHVARVPVPVRVLRSQPGTEDRDRPFAGSPTDPDLASLFPHGQDVPLPGLTHFIPMQAPDLVAAHIRELVDWVTGDRDAS